MPPTQAATDPWYLPHSTARSFLLLAACLATASAIQAQEQKAIRSNAVEVGGLSYTVIQQQETLHLQVTPATGGEATSSPIKGIPTVQAPLVTQLKLARWWKRGLALLFVTKTESKYTYSLAVFPFVEANVVQPSVWQKEFLESETDFNFIAVDGQLSGDTILITLHHFQTENGERKLTQGYVYLNDCPQPPDYFSLIPIEVKPGVAPITPFTLFEKIHSSKESPHRDSPDSPDQLPLKNR